MKDQVYVYREDTDVVDTEGDHTMYVHIAAQFEEPEEKRFSLCKGHGDSKSEAVKDLYRTYENYRIAREANGIPL